MDRFRLLLFATLLPTHIMRIRNCFSLYWERFGVLFLWNRQFTFDFYNHFEKGRKWELLLALFYSLKCFQHFSYTLSTFVMNNSLKCCLIDQCPYIVLLITLRSLAVPWPSRKTIPITRKMGVGLTIAEWILGNVCRIVINGSSRQVT